MRLFPILIAFTVGCAGTKPVTRSESGPPASAAAAQPESSVLAARQLTGGRTKITGNPSSLDAAVAAARTSIHELSGAGWSKNRAAVSDAMEQLVDVLKKVPDRSKEVDERLDHARVEANRMRDTKAWSVSGRLRYGLTDVLDAVQLLAGGEAGMKPWIDSARIAVQGISEEESIDFQRARVQDAFRSVIDAMAAGIDASARAD